MTAKTARAAALEALGRRDYSSGELLRRLVEKGFPEDDAAEAVGWCGELGYVDDEAYAARAAGMLRSKGYGPRRVAAYLEGKGVDRETARSASSGGEDGDDPSKTLDGLLSKIHRGTDWNQKEKKRCSDALFRRGFAWDDIRDAIGRACGGADGEYNA